MHDQLNPITRDLAERTGADTVLLVLRDGADGPFDTVSVWDAEERHDNLLLLLPPEGGGFARRVLDSDRAAVEPIAPGKGALVPAGAPRYAAGAPVRTPGGVTGVLYALYSQEPDQAVSLWVVESYARLVSLCLHDAGVLEGLVWEGRRDALTGCLSYGALHQEVARELGRSERHGRSLSCCFVDLDRFKAVNDRHGHLHGSRVLAEAAAELREGMRAEDMLGRYGGDEFLALLPDTDERDASALAERLRSRLATGMSDASGHIDASIGVAQWVKGSSAEEMLAAADDALRAAKARGGGMVVRASRRRLESVPGDRPARVRA